MSIYFAIDSLVPVRAAPSDRAEQVTELLFGESCNILEREGNWGRIECLHDAYTGYADVRMLTPGIQGSARRGFRLAAPVTVHTGDGEPRHLHIGSILPSAAGRDLSFCIGSRQFHFDRYPVFQPEVLPSPSLILEYAETYLGTPYRWGGRSENGIDCSGLVQQVYAATDIRLPRDAWQQAEYGRTVGYLQRKPGDLAFFTNASGKIIHVGIVGHGHDILHASVRVRKDFLFSTGVYSPEYKTETHVLYLIKRIL